MADFRQFNVGDRVHFGTVNTTINYDRIVVYMYEGIVLSHTWSGYVCKPDDGAERFVESSLVCSSHESLVNALRAELTQQKDHERRRYNAALAQLGKPSK